MWCIVYVLCVFLDLHSKVNSNAVLPRFLFTETESIPW